MDTMPQVAFPSSRICSRGLGRSTQTCELIKPLIQRNSQLENDTRREIFDRGCICFGIDNHFIGKVVEDLLGSAGMSGVFTCWCNCLPRVCMKQSFHYLKQVEVNQCSRVAWFAKPIFAVKHVKQLLESTKKDIICGHVSFQSTGSCNISTVNALDTVNLYCRKR